MKIVWIIEVFCISIFGLAMIAAAIVFTRCAISPPHDMIGAFRFLEDRLQTVPYALWCALLAWLCGYGIAMHFSSYRARDRRESRACEEKKSCDGASMSS
jgi:hypothetical protein